MSQTRDAGSAPKTRPATVGSADRAKRTVDVIWTTGARVARRDYAGPYFEELSLDPAHVRMERLASGNAPFLADHETGSVASQLGVIERASLTKAGGVATIRFSPEGIDPNADMVFEKIAAGVIRSVSVGYRTHAIEKGGEVDKVPVLRAVDWEPYEISAVALPADAGAIFRSQPKQKAGVNMENEQPKNELTTEDMVARERDRVAGIRGLFRRNQLDDDAAERLVASGTTLDNARKLAFEMMEARSIRDVPVGRSSFEIGEEDDEKFIRGATAGMLARAGMESTIASVVERVAKGEVKSPGVRKAFKDVDPDDDGGQFRGYTPSELARICLERRGIRTAMMSREQMIGAAFTRSGPYASTSDFAVILENVMYKASLGGYAQVDDSWRGFCGVESVEDFRPSNRYRLGSFGVLDTLGENGEYRRKSIPDGLKLSITTETRGNIIGISRAAIINDDMGALTDTANRFGRSAGLSIEKAVYDLLALNGGLGPSITLGGVTAPLFDDTAWKNVSTGAALSMAAIEADRVKMASQKDISNNEILGLRPVAMVLPESLRGEADAINRAKYDPTSASAFERPNIVGGLFRNVVGTPRLSGTRRYLFADPQLCAAILVVFLNGQQAPFMDQQQGWSVDGTEWRVRLDMKAQAFDPKGAITNAGA